MMFRWKVRY